MATYIVGDIQGCCSALKALLHNAQFDESKDKLGQGDLIGQPEALETLSFLYDLGSAFNTVLGNHDLHFLAVFNGIKKVNPKDKFESLLASPRINQFVDWLRKKPLGYLLSENIFLSHAGLYPQWTPKQALYYAQNVSNCCRVTTESICYNSCIATNAADLLRNRVKWKTQVYHRRLYTHAISV